ncbi:MAG: 2Fe-2S iron-sulfur cluster-binding protein [Rhodospirillaceae bacterium]
MADENSTPNTTSATPTVTFKASGVTLPWDPSFSTILEFAEENGLDPVYGCRDGFCHSCMCTLISGEVAYTNPSMVVMPDEGQVLICYSYPITDVVIDV